jgi:hypothetical protein
VSLLTPAAADAIRATLGQLLAHTYTRTPTDPGAEDAWGDTPPAAGTPETGVACLYRPNRRLTLPDGSRVTLDEPNLRIAFDDPVDVGDRVSDVADMDGTIIAPGPFIVSALEPVAGLGELLQQRATLTGAEVAE